MQADILDSLDDTLGYQEAIDSNLLDAHTGIAYMLTLPFLFINLPSKAQFAFVLFLIYYKDSYIASLFSDYFIRYVNSVTTGCWCRKYFKSLLYLHILL